MDSKTTIQCTKLIQLENSILMYGIYNVETLEKLINTVHHIHNTTSSTLYRTTKPINTQVTLCKCIRLTALFNTFTTLLENSTGQICLIVYRTDNTAAYLHNSNQGTSKGISTYFTHYTFEIKRNSR